MPRKTGVDRFFEKFRISKTKFFEGTPCWIWTAAKKQGGYGKFRVSNNRPPMLSHRWAYEYHIGPISEGLTLDHLCRVPGCVNPTHLEAVPLYVNVLRGDGWGGVNLRKTHCINGHELTKDNIYHGVKDKRVCLTCKKIRDKGYYETNKDKMKDYQKTYRLKRYATNKEKLKEYQRQRYAARKAAKEANA